MEERQSNPPSSCVDQASPAFLAMAKRRAYGPTGRCLLKSKSLILLHISVGRVFAHDGESSCDVIANTYGSLKNENVD
jgi:hypothetical protein